MIGTRPQVGQRAAEIADLAVGRPVHRRNSRARIALAVVAEVEGEDVIAQVAEVVDVRLEAPPVAEILVAVDQDARPALGPAFRR